MTDRLEEIVKEANEKLDLFYSAYGEWNGSGKVSSTKSSRKRCKHVGCLKVVPRDDDSSYCKEHQRQQSLIAKRIESEIDMDGLDDLDPLHEAPISRTKIINRPLPPKVEPQPKIIKPVKEERPLPPAKPSRKVISFEGFSSRQIIAHVKELSGKDITICVKSKINVIRHAKLILEPLGYTVK